VERCRDTRRHGVARHHTVPPGGFEPPTHGLGDDVRMRRCADCAANSMTIPCAIDAPLRRMRRPFGTGAGFGGLERVFDCLTLCAKWLASSNQREGAPILMPIFHPGARGRCHLLGYGVVIAGTAFEILVRGGPLRSLANRCERHALSGQRLLARPHQLPYVVSCPGMPGTSASMLMTRGVDERLHPLPCATRSLATD